MRKMLFSLVVTSFLIGGLSALAQDSNLPSAGLTPDSPFYFFKTLKENIQTFLTFGEENKAKQFLHLADVRLAEYQKMQEKGKTDLAQKTLDKYEKQLNRAISKIEELKNKGKDVKGLEKAIENARKIKPSKNEIYCKTDKDCACGTNKDTGNCFYGNKDYVNTEKQCPDFCSGITGKFKISCVDNQCEQGSSIVEKKYIQTGKFEIDYAKIAELQKSVDEGHQPWRLDPVFIAQSELTQYGFAEKDISKLYCPHIASNWVLGKDITSLPCEITHNDKKYTVMVEQPNLGIGKIWIITEIYLNK